MFISVATSAYILDYVSLVVCIGVTAQNWCQTICELRTAIADLYSIKIHDKFQLCPFRYTLGRGISYPTYIINLNNLKIYVVVGVSRSCATINELILPERRHFM